MSELTALRAKVESLEEELSGARDLVRAISRGEVDAVQVDGRFDLLDVVDRGDALERSMQLMRTVFDGATDAIVLTDRRGRVIDANPAAGSLFGRALGTLRDRAIVDLFESSPTLDAFWREGGDARLSEDVTVRRPDGARRTGVLRALANVLPGVDIVLLDDQTPQHEADEARQRAEDALRTTEARFRAMVDRSPAAVVLLDAEGTVLYGSGGIEQLIGAPPVDLVRRAAVDWIHPEDRSDVLTALAHVKEPPRAARSRQFRVIGRDGQVRWVDCVATNRLEDPDVEGVIVHLVDVTERELARQSQARSEARYRRFVEATTEGVVALDPDCRIVFANQRFGEIVGREAASLVGCRLDTLGDTALCVRLTGDDGSPPAQQRFEHAFRTPGGRVVWTQLSAAPLRDDAGAVEGTMLLASDITDRRRVSEARNLLAAIVESSDDAIIAVDLDGTITAWNPSAERLYGYSAAEAIGQPVSMLEDEDGSASWRRALAGDAPRHVEVRRRRRDGDIVWVALSVSPVLDHDGRMVGVSKVARDLTARRATEEALRQKEAQLRQAQKMEAIGSLAGGVAHDFNNLLSVILSYASLALDDLPPEAPLRPDLAEIRDAAERASTLTRQLLTFSRRQVLEPRLIDVNACVDGVQRMLGRLLGEHIVQRTTLEPDLPRVMADAGQLEQVVMNLAVNARDAMPTGGTLTLETQTLTLDEDAAQGRGELEPGTYVRLVVGDTGCGMDAATIARAFEPFFTTKPVGRGTGLGLATVFGIIQQSRGHVKVDSAVGRGTRIEVLLPAARAGSVSVPPSPSDVGRARRGDETILLVEDDPALRRIVRTILLREGYRVLDAADGETALQRCADPAQPVHLLLTDVVMPRMSGRELAERLRAERPDVQVVYMSGYTEDAIVHHGVYEDRMHFVHKPIVPARLTAKLREVLAAA
ncbi:MAG: PAS domain S-box protein [Myxococcales bacterium]|nr:PAS domain S-box protein [Myxococcales bacterium]